MKKLLYYEYRKILFQKIFLFLLVVLLLVNVIFVRKSIDVNKVEVQKETVNFLAEYEKDPAAMEDYMKKYTEAYEMARKTGAGFPQNLYSENSDFVVFRRFRKLQNYTETYRATLQNAETIAKSRLLEYEYLGYSDRSFETVYQTSVLRSYEPLEALTFPADQILGYDTFYSYSGFGFLLLLGVGLLAIRIVTQEKGAGMLMILKTTKGGRHRTMTAKLLVGFSLTAVLCILFAASTLLTVFGICGLHGWNLPIQMVENMQFCPYPITVGEGIVLTVLMQILTSCTFFAVAMFFAAAIGNTLGIFSATLVFIGVNFAIANYHFFNGYSFFKNMNLFWTLSGMQMLSVWRGVKCFGTGIGSVPLWLTVYTLLLVVASVLSVFLFANRKITGRNRRWIQIRLPKIGEILNRPIRYPKSLYRFEMKKIMSPLSCFLLVAAILLTVYTSVEEYHLKRDFEMYFYTSFMENLEGEWSEEKHRLVETEYENYAAVMGAKERKKQEYESGLLSQNDYGRYLSDYMDAEVRMPTMRRILERSNYLKEKHGEGYAVSFFDDTGWNQLQKGNLAYIMCILCIILFSDAFAVEKRSGTDKMLRASVGGRGRTVWMKFAVCCTVAFGVGFLSEMIQYITVASFSGLPGMSAVAYSMEIDSALSVGGCFALASLKNGLLFTLLSAVTAGVSMATKRLLPTLATVSVLVFAPTVLAYFGIAALEPYSFLTLFGR